jgi:hypothetical protein
LCIDAEVYVGVAHSEEKSMENYVGGIDLASDILFLAAYKIGHHLLPKASIAIYI